MKRIILTLLVCLSLLVAGCQTYPVEEFETDEKEVPTSDDEPEQSSVTDISSDEEESNSNVDSKEEPESNAVTGNTVVEAPKVRTNNGIPRKTVIEGDFVSFPSLQALTVDADGDPVTVSYSEPLDENGEWQTEKGDAAEYLLVFRISDGQNERVQRLVLEVLPDNKAPVMAELSAMQVHEGDTITLNPQVTDADSDPIVISYEGFMNEPTKDVTAADIGEHTVTVTAFDGYNRVSQEVAITVLKKNKAPLIEKFAPISVVEGDMIQIDVVAADPDGDELEISFSTPVDSLGRWQTREGDDGVYSITVSATDGEATTIETVRVTVEALNKKPVISGFEDVTVNEGDTIVFSPRVTDPEGEDVTLTYSGFMTSDTYTTGSQDAGVYTVKLVASDGVKSAQEVVTVTVNDVNNAPEFPEGNWWE